MAKQFKAQIFKVTDSKHMDAYLALLSECNERGGTCYITAMGDGLNVLLTVWWDVETPNTDPLVPF